MLIFCPVPVRFVKKSLERVCTNLQSRALASLDDQTLRSEFEREKQQREAEWQRLHPGMDAFLSHRRAYEERNENDESDTEANNSMNEEEFEAAARLPGKRRAATTASTRGRSRGRGRGSSAAAAPAALPLHLSTDPSASVAASFTPHTASRWPPRR